MTYFKTLLFAFFLIATSFTTQDPCSVENSTFVAGEKITYKLYYNWGYVWLAAGEVDFEVTENESQYIIEARGKTYPSYEWFFKVDDYFKSVVNKKTLLPIEFERDVHEGGYVMYNKIEFDQYQNKAVSHKGRERSTTQAKTHEFNDCMHDILSSVYYMRNLDFGELSVHDKVPVNVMLDHEEYPLKVHYMGEETKKIKGMGKFNTLKLSPEVVAGTVFDENSVMNIWVSNDKNKIPLEIESPVSVGSIKAVLKSYSGLKTELKKG